MCLIHILGLVSIIPYILLFLMPLYGSYYGKEVIIRLALYLISQSIASSFISQFLVVSEPLIQLAIFIAFLSLRISVIPYPAVWCMDKILFVSEPLWQISEAFGVVFLVMEISQEVVDHIDDNENLAKGLILGVSGLCYSCLLYLVWSIMAAEATLYIWAAILLLVVIVIIHILVISQENGILCDAAMVGLCSMALLYDIQQNSTVDNSHTNIPHSWTEYMAEHSYSQMFLHIIISGLGGGGPAWHMMSRVFSPWFLVTTLARIACTIYIINIARTLTEKIYEKMEWEQSTEDSVCDTEDEETSITWTISQSPLVIKLVVIFVYTQFLVCHVINLHEDSSLLSWLQSWFPS